MSVREFLNKTNIQALLAFMIVCWGMFILAYASTTNDVKIAMVSFITIILNFYFGSSQNSQKKDDTISQMAQNTNGNQ